MKFILCLSAAISLFAPSVLSDEAVSKPNIIIIFTDDQGYADVGKFGAEGFVTPNLDRMADQGALFRNFHVAQPVCSASRCALITGCYPNRIGIHGALGPKSKVGLSDKETTLAQLLKSRGYATGMFGKWHLGDAPQFMPLHHGFDEYFGPDRLLARFRRVFPTEMPLLKLMVKFVLFRFQTELVVPLVPPMMA